MNISLSGYRALVCGSTQGIGKAIALELSLAGASVVLMARNETALQETMKQLHAVNGQQHTYVVADFADTASVAAAVPGALTAGPVHILINNTGGPKPGSLKDSDPALLEQAFRMHLVNYQQLAQAVIPGMRADRYGRIINIISTSVRIPIAGLGVSNTIRAATAGWAKTLSLELAADGITVNNILPGFTETARLQSLIRTNAEKAGIPEQAQADRMIQGIPARRFGDPAELANVAAFLASPAASYVNGVSIPVDGGSTGAF